MDLPELFEGTLVRRYKRFLADIETSDGVITAHCPNTGAMIGCAEPGMQVHYSLSDNPKRKYAATWELVETPQGLCSVNTGRANRLVAEGITAGVIGGFGDIEQLQSEAAIPGGAGRFDFLVHAENGSKAYVEVKSVTLAMAPGRGAFPDAVSSRATKHVNELVKQVSAGHRGVLIFCAQHCGIEKVVPAADIDPVYAAALRQAVEQGVEVLAYGCAGDLNSFRVNRKLEFGFE